ncbi:MAG: hypothetical protein A4E55_02304 [Pelotomaculum sp. PtaU1.Bin035]|nr:MAG: hypothetical protein A4E55_02304 [Pelotomaculum sp. PtaU1.Bin035]
MKRLFIASIVVIACVALCAAVWPRNAEVGDLPAESAETAVNDEIEARSEEIPQIFIPVDAFNPELEATAESESPKTDITADEKTETVPPATPKLLKTQAQPSSNPKSGGRAIIDGRPHIWIPGFGWIVDEGGGSNGILVDGEGDINKQVGVMGGGKTVGNPGDELTGNKVGIMGGGTVAADMYENGHKIGIMGGSEPQSREAITQPSEQAELTGKVIYIELVETPTKNSTPPPYKPSEALPNP